MPRMINWRPPTLPCVDIETVILKLLKTCVDIKTLIYKELTKETSVGPFASLMTKTSKADNCDKSEDEKQQSFFINNLMCPQSQSPTLLTSFGLERVGRSDRRETDVVFFSKLFLLPSSDNSGQLWWISVFLVDLIWSWTSRNAGGQVADKEIDLPMSKGPLLTNSLSLSSFTVDKFY